MTGLVDCNNFFVSCERIFNPRLRGVPVVVLSNNDGCIVALSNEAKAVGLRRGDPMFKVSDICRRNNVAVLSGNHRLYGDISSRVMTTVSAVAGSVHVYSIDECFIDFAGLSGEALTSTAREIVRRVRRDVGIPTSLGIAPTSTLAKMASRFAKKYPAYRCVCAIDNDYRRRRALELTDIGDVWGIGRRLVRRLANYGISKAVHLAERPESEVEQMLNVAGMRTWRELNGVPCITPDCGDDDKPQKQMACTRSFASPLTTEAELAEAVAIFSTIIGSRLRKHGLAAAGVSVFIHTSRFRPDAPQYCNSAYRQLAEPSNDTMAIASAATAAMRSIFREGFGYKRAGIFITELSDARHVQASLFTDAGMRLKKQRLMAVVDALNASSLSHDRVHIASYVPIESCVRCESRSPDFSTRLDDVIRVS